ncbi:MAG: HNH endonuclease [Dehalococcoidales bacterium]
MASTPKTIDLGNGHTAILDAYDYARLYRYAWRAVKHGRALYAKTTVGKGIKQCDLSMHRMVAHTPFGLVCHHRNRNSLDNRLDNLTNMTRQDHDMLHKNDTLCIKFSDGVHPSPSELLSQPKTNFFATKAKNPNF